MARLCAIRGAITANNTIESIQEQTIKLINEIIHQNNLEKKSFVTVLFSLTNDLTKYNPATALREKKDFLPFDFSDIPLFCVQEPFVENSLECVIRVLITGYFKNRKNLKFIYLDGAKNLRPDLINLSIKN